MEKSSEEGKTRLQSGFQVGDWWVEPQGNRLRRKEESHRIGSRAMDLLTFLATRPGETVSKDEIFASVWRDTFVSDNALWKCVSELRQVLEDNPANPQYIVTVPRRGYRLEGMVSPQPAFSPALRRPSRFSVGGMVMAIPAIGSLLALSFLGRSTTGSWDQDTPPQILIARLENRTGVRGMNGIVERVLEARLSQSEQFQLAPQSRVEAALESMQLSPSAQLSEDISRQVAVRDGQIDLVLTGQLDRVGQIYRLALQLHDGESFDLVSSATRETEKIEALLQAADELSIWMIDRLMTVDSVERPPPERVTTASMEALSYYTRGLDLYATSQDSALSPRQQSTYLESARALFQDAARVDPEFAPAQLMLAVSRRKTELDDPRRGADLRFEVRYLTDPANPFNLVPDDKGIFQSWGCVPPECPYVDGENGFIIGVDGFGAFRQVQQFDRDLKDLFGGIFHYRYFETDIEAQAVEGELCPTLIVPANGRTLGGSYEGEPMQKIRFSLFLETWPQSGEESIWTPANALMVGLAPVEDETGPVSRDFDMDRRPESLLAVVSPHQRLAWHEQDYPGTRNLLVTRGGRGFRVQSTGKAMLLAHRRGGNEQLNCGLVDARFEFLATLIP